MIRHLAWILTAALALGACGAGDRKQDEETTTPDPMAEISRPAPLEDPTPAPPPVAIEEPMEDLLFVHPTERLYTVQIAAYLSPDSAHNLADRLSARGLPTWTMEVRLGDQTYHRIRVGAHPGLREMRRLGEQISTQFRQEIWVAPVDMSSRIPADAVEATAALLSR